MLWNCNVIIRWKESGVAGYRLSKFIKLLFVFGDDVLELSEVEKGN